MPYLLYTPLQLREPRMISFHRCTAATILSNAFVYAAAFYFDAIEPAECAWGLHYISDLFYLVRFPNGHYLLLSFVSHSSWKNMTFAFSRQFNMVIISSLLWRRVILFHKWSISHFSIEHTRQYYYIHAFLSFHFTFRLKCTRRFMHSLSLSNISRAFHTPANAERKVIADK